MVNKHWYLILGSAKIFFFSTEKLRFLPVFRLIKQLCIQLILEQVCNWIIMLQLQVLFDLKHIFSLQLGLTNY